jgi:hypothetical protein
MQKMGEIKKKGTTIIFVSHNIPDVQKICQKCLFLNDSKLICNSNTNEVVQEYYKYVSSSTDVNKEDRAPAGKTGVTLSKFVIRDAKGKQKKVFQTGEKMLIECRFLVDKPISNPILHVTFSGDTYHGYNTRDDGVQIEILDSSTEILLEINFLGLSSGIYSVCVGLWDNNYLYPYYWNWNAKILEIRSANAPLGRFVFKHNWEILHKKESQS